MASKLSTIVGAVVVLALAASAAATTASAGTIRNQAAPCSGRVLERPFTRWLDPLSYTLVPDGGLEQGGSTWTLTGGARVAAGNEPWYVHGAGERSSLLVPRGATATTRAVCVQLGDLVARFFARGNLLTALKVDVVWEDFLGLTHTTPVGAVAGLQSWQPTLPQLVPGSAMAPFSVDGTTAIALRFTALGGPWLLDDVYVDPFKILP